MRYSDLIQLNETFRKGSFSKEDLVKVFYPFTKTGKAIAGLGMEGSFEDLKKYVSPRTFPTLEEIKAIFKNDLGLNLEWKEIHGAVARTSRDKEITAWNIVYTGKDNKNNTVYYYRYSSPSGNQDNSFLLANGFPKSIFTGWFVKNPIKRKEWADQVGLFSGLSVKSAEKLGNTIQKDTKAILIKKVSNQINKTIEALNGPRPKPGDYSRTYLTDDQLNFRVERILKWLKQSGMESEIDPNLIRKLKITFYKQRPDYI